MGLKYFSFLLLFLFSIDDIKYEQKLDLISPPNIVWITSEDNSKHYMKLFDNNGVATPNIEKLASHGLIFKNAFSNGPVCSVARSTIISGCYSPRIGAQFHRKFTAVPMPVSLKMFPYYLHEAGYHTTNNSKKDYNIIEDDKVWDESSKEATWRSRGKDQPFFHVYNIEVSHESGLHFSANKFESENPHTDLNSFNVQPKHPDTKLFRYTNAVYRDKIMEMDRRVGAIMNELEKDGLMENTFIFYFGDHGGVLPGSKGYLYETGLHVPMVVYVPEKYKHLARIGDAGTVKGFVSFIDLAPTVLNLAGVKIPTGIDGRAFLGKGITKKSIDSRNRTFSYADRFDEKYDLVRAVRKGKYKYIRNFQPYNPDALMNNYRYKQLAYQEWLELFRRNELSGIQSSFFRIKEPEMLFDVESDPFETVNLAADKKFSSVLSDMRLELNTWLQDMPDLSFYPEYYLMDSAFVNPTAFGKKHKNEISTYLSIANLNLSPIERVKDQLAERLQSNDPWERYWALIASSSFGQKANELVPLILQISKRDDKLVNRVRASEFLAIAVKTDPTQTMVDCLYKSNNPAEALLILNSITLMASYQFGYTFKIELEKISGAVKMDSQVRLRLEYLNAG